MPKAPKINPNPSTYKQVIENMKSIGLMQDDIELLERVIVESPPSGDVQVTDDGLKVKGVHINTKNAETNGVPNEYVHGVTWEFKNTTVVGLKGQTGYTGNYCTVMTVKQDTTLEGESASSLGVDPYQIAYGTDGIYFQKREATGDNAWGPWVPQKVASGSTQFVDSTETPTDQSAGDYWTEPITI